MLTGQMTCMDASNVLYGFACAGVHDCELLSGLTARFRRLAADLSDNIQARDFEASSLALRTGCRTCCA